MITEKQEIIYSTDDYSVFKRLKGNRCIANKRLNIIKASIESVGYISNPIIVNEKMEIVDGQGRAEALQQLMMPVEYRIVKGLGIEECRAMNLKPTSWKITDFVDSYSEYDNENYSRLKKLEEEFHLGYTPILSIWGGVSYSGSKCQNELRNGTFVFTEKDYEETREKIIFCLRFTEIQKIIGGRRGLFFSIVSYVWSIEGVDRERLSQSMLKQYNKITPVGRVEDTLKQISDCYNYGYSQKQRMYFDYIFKTKQ